MFVLVASLVAHVVADELHPSSLFGLPLASESEQDYGCKTWSWWLQRGCLKPGYELGFLYLRGYKTWLQNLVLLSLDTTPERPALVEQFYLDVLLVGACFSVCVGAHIRMFVHLDSGIL